MVVVEGFLGFKEGEYFVGKFFFIILFRDIGKKLFFCIGLLLEEIVFFWFVFFLYF